MKKSEIRNIIISLSNANKSPADIQEVLNILDPEDVYHTLNVRFF